MAGAWRVNPVLLSLAVCLLVFRVAAAQEPVTLPFADGFEGKTPFQLPRTARVARDEAHDGRRSLAIAGAEGWRSGAFVALPAVPDRMTYRFSVRPHDTGTRQARGGFFETFGKSVRFYNYVALRTRGGKTGDVVFKSGMDAKPVKLGAYRAGRWFTFTVRLDFARGKAEILREGESVAKDVPIVARSFTDPRHGNVVLTKWAVGHRFWPSGQPGRTFFDDIRIFGGIGDPPEEEDLAAEIERLAEALRSEDRDVRYRAAEALGELGDPRSVAPLRRALASEDSQLRILAAHALGGIGGEEAVSALVAALEDESDMVRTTVVHALGRIDGESAFRALVGLLGSEDGELRAGAAGALGGRGDGRAMEPLSKLLRDPDGKVRAYVATALSRLGWKPDTDEDRAWFLVARNRCGQAARLGAVAVPPLIEALKYPDPMLRPAAARALVQVGAEAIEPLRALADHADREIRRLAAVTLTELGHHPEDPADRARQLVAAWKWEEAIALGKPSVAPLVEALRLRDGAARRAAAEALERLGWQPAGSGERAWRLVAVGRVEEALALGEAALEPLVNALASETFEMPGGRPGLVTSAKAARALGVLGDPRAVEPLVAALQRGGHEGADVRTEAVRALRKLGDRRAVEPLIERLGDEDAHVRVGAALGLGSLDDERAVEPLRKAMEVREREKEIEEAAKRGGRVAGLLLVQIRITRCAAAAGLCMLGEEDALPTVLAALEDESAFVRAIAAFVLIDVAPKSEAAARALEAALNDESWRVREHAEKALRAIREKDD